MAGNVLRRRRGRALASFPVLVLIDPYDSGRFPGLGIVGVDDASPRTSNVSLGRDPQFDAVVIGNSNELHMGNGLAREIEAAIA